MNEKQHQSVRRMTGIRAFAAGVMLAIFAEAALALPIGRDDYFTYSSISMASLSSPFVDMNIGANPNSGATTTSVKATFHDSYAQPGSPAFNDPNAILPLTGSIDRQFFATAYSQSGLGAGASRAFGRQSFGDGQAHMNIVSGFGDIVTVAPGGTLDASLSFGAAYRFLFERVPTTKFDFPEVLYDFNNANVLGEAITVRAQFGIWDYNAVAATPFGQFGDAATVSLDCSGGLFCLNRRIDFGPGDALQIPSVSDVTFGAGDGAGIFSALGGLGFSSEGVSLSKGSGGKYYIGVQLIVDIQSQIFVLLNDSWQPQTLAQCLTHTGGSRGSGCEPMFTQPAAAFDMTRSLDVNFTGDAAYSSQSGVFLIGSERVPEPATLALLGLGLAGLGFSRHRNRSIRTL